MMMIMNVYLPATVGVNEALSRSGEEGTVNHLTEAKQVSTHIPARPQTTARSLHAITRGALRQRRREEGKELSNIWGKKEIS